MLRNVANDSLERDAFSIAEVASRYGVSKGLVRLEIARGRLRSARIGRRVIITKREVEHWLNEPQGLA